MVDTPRSRVPRKSPAHMKPRRATPGDVARREIYLMQTTTGLLIPKKPFGRFARAIGKDIKPDIRFKPEAIIALQHVAEAYVIERLAKASIAAHYAKRITIQPKDMSLVRIISKE